MAQQAIGHHFWWSGKEEELRRKYAPVRAGIATRLSATTLKAISDLTGATTQDNINAALKGFSQGSGISRSGCLSIFQSDLGIQGHTAAIYQMEEYTDAYIVSNKLSVDCISFRAREEIFPIPFGLAHHYVNPHQDEKKLYDLLNDFNIGRGLLVPLHGPNSFSVLGLKVDECERDFVARLPVLAGEAQLFATYLHDAMRRISSAFKTGLAGTPSTQKLTAREIECLHWAAAGKTAWEISAILGISERTAIAHTENVKKKLDARTLPQAVARAVSRGLISV